MRQSYEEYKARLKIDADNLDQELITGQFDLQEIVEAAIEAEFARDAASQETKYAYADLDMQVRTEPVRFGIDAGKVTEARVAAAVVSHSRHKQAVDDFEQKKRNALLWRGLVDSWQRKTSASRNLADLYMTGFFAPTSNTRRLSDYQAQQGRQAMASKRVPLSPK
jgi:hypothetical protein